MQAEELADSLVVRRTLFNALEGVHLFKAGLAFLADAVFVNRSALG